MFVFSYFKDPNTSATLRKIFKQLYYYDEMGKNVLKSFMASVMTVAEFGGVADEI